MPRWGSMIKLAASQAWKANGSALAPVCMRLCLTVNIFMCALKVRFMSRKTLRVSLTWIGWLPMERAVCQILSLFQGVQVEKRKTSLLLEFKLNFHYWLQSKAVLFTDWAAASASPFLLSIVTIETSLENIMRDCWKVYNRLISFRKKREATKMRKVQLFSSLLSNINGLTSIW